MTNPEVPQAAIDAAMAAMYDTSKWRNTTYETLVEILITAAAPHIGAAWLRWAADYLPPTLIQDHNKLWLRKVAARIEAGDG